jgi:hypothetical protein
MWISCKLKVCASSDTTSTRTGPTYIRINIMSVSHIGTPKSLPTTCYDPSAHFSLLLLSSHCSYMRVSGTPWPFSKTCSIYPRNVRLDLSLTEIPSKSASQYLFCQSPFSILLHDQTISTHSFQFQLLHLLWQYIWTYVVVYIALSLCFYVQENLVP